MVAPLIIAAGITAGASLLGGLFGSSATKKAAKEQRRGVEASIAEQKAAREQFFERTQPFVDIGLQGGQLLTDFLAAPIDSFQPTAEGDLFDIAPIVDFFREQGFEAIQESAAASGRLGAGGTLEDLTRFSEGLASTTVPGLLTTQENIRTARFGRELTTQQQQLNERQQRFNELFNVTGLGANVAVGQGQAALTTGANVGNALTTIGRIGGQEAIGQANVGREFLGNISGLAGAFPSLFGGQPQIPIAAGAQPDPRLTGPFPPQTAAAF